MPRVGLLRKSEDLLQRTHRLMQELEAFRRSAKQLPLPLDKLIGEAEVEAMDSPRANVLGILERLLHQDVGGILRLLAELAGYLEAELRAGDLWRGSQPEPERRALRVVS